MRGADSKMGKLNIAYGEVDITPHFPVDLSGYGARINPSLGMLDPIFATFIVFELEEKRALLLSFDLLAVGKYLKGTILSYLRDLGFSNENVFLFTTHTHSAPATGAVPYMGTAYQLWLDELGKGVRDAVGEALKKKEHQGIKFGKGETEISLNRRCLEGWLPQKKDEGYVEKEIAVLLCGDIPLLSFTCHAVCLTEKNRFISADFPGRTRVYLKYFLNAPCVLMANGAAGDQNPREREIYGVEKTGRDLAESALLAINKAEELRCQSMDYVHKKVSFPLAEPPTLDELEEFITCHREGLESVSLPEQVVRRSYIRWAEDVKEKVKKGYVEREACGRISLLRIGDIAFLFLPGEVFSEIGSKCREILQAKGLCPFIVGYYDDLVGYIPTAYAFEEGGYEISDAYKWYGKPAPFLPSIEDIVLETARELSEKI